MFNPSVRVTASEAISGEWFGLIAAAKEWFKANHAIEPATEYAEDTESTWFSGWSTVSAAKTNKKSFVKKSESELVLTCRDAINDALVDLQQAMSVNFFSMNLSGFFFEFRRCWFLTTSQSRVLESICKVELIFMLT